MNELVVDCGNSHLKFSLLESGKLSDVTRIALSRNNDWREMALFIQKKPSVIYVSSVASADITNSLVKFCESHWKTKINIVSVAKYTHHLPTRYDIKQLGIDRWLAMLACHTPGKATLVVDAGTAITLDFVSTEGVHLGGYILPGLHSMREALQRNTSLSPASAQADVNVSHPQTTAMAVELGPLRALIALINEMMSDKGEVVLYLGGGDAGYIQTMVTQQSIKLDQMVLLGMARLVQLESDQCAG